MTRRRGEPAAPPLALVGIVVLSVTFVGFMRVPLLPDIARDLRLSTGEVSSITAAFAIGRLVMDLPAGRIADRLPPGVALSATGVVISLAAALLAGAQSLLQALVATSLLGLVSAQTNMTGMKEFATRGPESRRGRTMAGFSNYLMTGQMLGPALGGAVAGLVGWRAAQLSGTLVGVGVAVACVVAARRVAARRVTARPPATARAAAAARPARAQDAEAGSDAPAGAMRLTRRDGLVLAGVPFAVFFAMGGVSQTLVPLIAADDLGLGPAVIGLAIGLGGLTRALGALAAGRLSDAVSRKAALVPGLLVMVAGVLLLAPGPTLATWLTALALIALGSSGIPVAATMIADRVPPGALGRHLGGYRFLGDFGLLAGPLLAGFAAEHAGRGAAMALTAAVLLVSVASLSLVSTVPRPLEVAPA
jgi:MFS family permease